MKKKIPAGRVVTFTRCMGLDIGGHGRKVRGTMKIWVRGAYDEAKASLTLTVDKDAGPQMTLNPMPADFVQDRDLIAHGMEVVAMIESVTATEFFYDDPELQKTLIEDAAEEIGKSKFEQAVDKLELGGVSHKGLLSAGTTTAIGRLK